MVLTKQILSYYIILSLKINNNVFIFLFIKLIEFRIIKNKMFLFTWIILGEILCAFTRDPVLINPVNPNDAEKLPSGVEKRVLVVGGGLAGLSAALELAERGYSVTIKEKFPDIGGKLFCRPVQILNQTFNIEHGFHGKLSF